MTKDLLILQTTSHIFDANRLRASPGAARGGSGGGGAPVPILVCDRQGHRSLLSAGQGALCATLHPAAAHCGETLAKEPIVATTNIAMYNI